MEKCKICGQKMELARVDFGDGTCVFCHKELDNKNDNYGRPKWDYVRKLQNFSDDELFAETKQMIWLSAYANNNPRSDYHFQCDLCYNECVRRGNEAMYSRAHKQAF